MGIPVTKVALKKVDPGDKSDWKGRKAEGKEALRSLSARLEDLQGLLYAQRRHKLLIILQSMDCGGKDSTIRHVFKGVNPQGVRVATFKKPTHQELAHDYLWRVHRHTPARGEIAIFNRSHYEDVLVVRVHNLISKKHWRKRFRHIVNFEEMLSDEGVTIRKFFLHISPDEQRNRLQERLENPRKRWKFSRADLEERALWDSYSQAYEEVLESTSTEKAPWYVVPANSKWYRNLVISSILVETLEGLGMEYPAPESGLDDVSIEDPK